MIIFREKVFNKKPQVPALTIKKQSQIVNGNIMNLAKSETKVNQVTSMISRAIVNSKTNLENKQKELQNLKNLSQTKPTSSPSTNSFRTNRLQTLQNQISQISQNLKSSSSQLSQVKAQGEDLSKQKSGLMNKQ